MDEEKELRKSIHNFILISYLKHIPTIAQKHGQQRMCSDGFSCCRTTKLHRGKISEVHSYFQKDGLLLR